MEAQLTGRWRAALRGWGETMLSQPEPRVSGTPAGAGRASGLGRYAVRARREAAEALSTPRKWPERRGRWPFKRRPRPVAPPHAPGSGPLRGGGRAPRPTGGTGRTGRTGRTGWARASGGG